MLVTGNPPPKKGGGDYSALIQQSFLHFEERNENLFKTLHKLQVQDLIKNIHVFSGQNLYQLIHVFM